MRYFRMLTNSVIGGGLIALYVTILVLQLNPGYGLSGLFPLAVTFALSYGVHATAIFYVFFVLRQLTTAEVLSPGWISFRSLVWVVTAATAAGSILMWINLRSFRSVLDQDTLRRMASGAVALTACAVVALGLALVHVGFRRSTSRVRAAVLGLVVVASVALPLTARGPGTNAPPVPRWRDGPAEPSSSSGDSRITVILLEGGSLDMIRPAAAEGRLPHLGRILDAGASMHVASLRPVQPAPVWTAAASGKLPGHNGIRSAASYWPMTGQDRIELLPDYCFAQALVRFGFLHQDLHTSSDIRARPVWSILNSQGIAVGVVNWPITHPARPIQGYMVTDRFQRMQESSIDPENAGVIWPQEALPLAMSVAPAKPLPGPQIAVPPSEPHALEGLGITQPCAVDRTLEQVASELDRQYPVRVSIVRYECLDAAGHYFLRYAVPWAFGDVSNEERQRYGQVLDSYYAAADATVGRAMALLKPGDLLLVMSGFGMDPLGIGKRLIERAFGNPGLSGTHEKGPDGFLLAYGSMVRPGSLARASVLDLTPTILYYLGLPVGRDMDGSARTDIFLPAFTSERPISYIPSYDK
jgi:hypothetical protein